MAYVVDDSLGAIGQVMASLLTLAQHQGLYGPGWELCAAQSLPATTALAIVAGYSALPNASGVGLRGKNNGATTANNNQAGDLALGTYQADATAVNGLHDMGHSHTVPIIYDAASTEGSYGPNLGHVTQPTSTASAVLAGDAETVMKNITVNFFVRIS